MSKLTEVPQVTVAVALYSPSGHSVLLQEFFGPRYDSQWGFAGGKVDPDESPLIAAYRELWEETGIRPSEVQLDEARYWSYDRFENTDEHFVCVYFTGKPYSDLTPHARVTEPDKTRRWRWTPQDTLRDLWGQGRLLPGCVGFLDL